MKTIVTSALFRAFSLAFVLVALPSGPAVRAADADFRELRFDFGLIGDTPYDAMQITKYFPNLIAEMNAVDLAFVVHDGDIKSGSTPCTDDVLEARLRDFQSFRHPLFYTFGDNEWSDCGKTATNKFNPDERLEKLRALFAPGRESFGQRKLPLVRQSDGPRFALFRENIRWVFGNVVFAGLNVPGNANNFGAAEFAARHAANLAWIKESFTLATTNRALAVMLIFQANPHFDLASTNGLRRGFNEMLRVIEDETLAFGRPVVLVHGDSHEFRIDKPLMGSKSGRRIENFTRVETFGNPDVHWVRASVDPADPNVFTFRPQIVKGNVIRHR